MNKKRYWLQFIGLFVVFIGVYLFIATQSAEAVGSPWAKWKIQVNFQNNLMNTILVVQIGHTTATGKKIIDQEQNFPVTCQPVGNPIIQGQKAIFNGSSYFECQVPSIKAKVVQMTNGALMIPDECDSKQPYVTGVLAIEDNPIQLAANNPLFYREDISFSTPLDVTTQQAQLLVLFDEDEAESASFALSGSSSTVTAVYDKTGPNLYTPLFKVDGITLASTPVTLNGPMFLSTLESTVYFGYSPITSEYFEGSLTSLIVDPYCVGTG